MTLWKHQQNILDRFGTKNLLYAGMGSGKTRVALEWLERIGGLSLIIAPKPALSVYEEDVLKFGLKSYVMTLSNGTVAQKIQALDAAAMSGEDTIVVVNYEAALRMPLGDYLFSAVVLDEAHRISKVALDALLKPMEDGCCELV